MSAVQLVTPGDATAVACSGLSTVFLSGGSQSEFRGNGDWESQSALPGEVWPLPSPADTHPHQLLAEPLDGPGIGLGLGDADGQDKALDRRRSKVSDAAPTFLSPHLSFSKTPPQFFSLQTPVSIPSLLPRAAPLRSGQAFSASAGGTVFPPSHGYLLYR